MKRNIGGIDRLLRIIIGLALLSLIVILDGDARWFGLIGIVPLATAAIGWCPAYTLIGLNSCRR